MKKVLGVKLSPIKTIHSLPNLSVAEFAKQLWAKGRCLTALHPNELVACWEKSSTLSARVLEQILVRWGPQWRDADEVIMTLFRNLVPWHRRNMCKSLFTVPGKEELFLLKYPTWRGIRRNIWPSQDPRFMEPEEVTVDSSHTPERGLWRRKLTHDVRTWAEIATAGYHKRRQSLTTTLLEQVDTLMKRLNTNPESHLDRLGEDFNTSNSKVNHPWFQLMDRIALRLEYYAENPEESSTDTQVTAYWLKECLDVGHVRESNRFHAHENIRAKTVWRARRDYCLRVGYPGNPLWVDEFPPFGNELGMSRREAYVLRPSGQ